jgi:hypothetical protein
MYSRIALFLSTLILGLCLALGNDAAQEKDLDTSPLTVTTEFSSSPVADCNASASFIARFHYKGEKELRGYLVRFDFVDPGTGILVQRQTVQEIRDSREPLIATGAEWTRSFCNMYKTSTEDRLQVTAKVDVLKFADNSTWGPIALPESHRLVGELDGLGFMSRKTQLETFVSPILPEHGALPVQRVESQTIGPLRIESGGWLNEHGQELLAFEITNESNIPIRGFLFVTSFFDPATGNRIRRFSTKELETHGNPSDYLAAGSSWVADPRKFSYLTDGSPAPYKINLDLVVFADGSTYGPKKSAESNEVLGMLRGIDGSKEVGQAVGTKREH